MARSKADTEGGRLPRHGVPPHPKRATRQQRDEFWRLVNGGKVSLTYAAEMVGMSRTWGWRQAKASGYYEMEKRRRADYGPGAIPDPKGWDDLDGGLRDLLQPEGFDAFCEVFFVRDPSPWRHDAAMRFLEWLLDDTERTYVDINTPPGAGKALALDTPLPTPTGWTTMKEVEVDDEVYGSDGQPCRVVATSDVFYDHDCYRVRTDDGAEVIADADHLWRARIDSPYHPRPGPTGPKASPDGRQVRTTRDIARHRAKRPSIAVASPLRGTRTRLAIDPYVLGVWLGDGTSLSASITTVDTEILDHIRGAGYEVTRRADPISYGVKGLARGLRHYGLYGNKHVPEDYLRATAPKRLALLQGLIDTDGYVSERGMVEFSSTKRRLAEAVQFLARSLGVKAALSEGRAVLDGRDCGPKFRVTFYLEGAARLRRKRDRTRNGRRTTDRYLDIEPVASVPTRCIMVDSPDRQYLAGEGLMVTHNTVLFTHDIPVWLTAGGGFADPGKGRALRALLGSFTKNVSIHYVLRVRRSLERTRPFYDKRSKRLAELSLPMAFGRFKPDAAAGDESLWRAEQFLVAQLEDIDVYEKEPTFQAASRESGFLGERVDYEVWDDISTTATAYRPEAAEELNRWYEDEAETRVEPGGLGVLVGQRLSSVDLHRKRLDARYVDDDGEERPIYRHLVYQAHYEDSCGAPDEPHGQWDPDTGTGCLLDRIRLPWKDLRVAMGKPSWATVYQQADSDPFDALVQQAWIDGGIDALGFDAPGSMDKDRGFNAHPQGVGKLVNYACVDPAAGGYWVIEWWAIQPETRVRYLIWGMRTKMAAGGLLDWDPTRGVHTGTMEDLTNRSCDLGQPILCWVVESNSAFRHLLQYEHYRTWRRKWARVAVLPHDTQSNKADPDKGVQATLSTLYRVGFKRLPSLRSDLDALNYVRQKVRELTTYPNAATWDTVMADWCGEFNIEKILALGERFRAESKDESKSWKLPDYLNRQRKEVPLGVAS